MAHPFIIDPFTLFGGVRDPYIGCVVHLAHFDDNSVIGSPSGGGTTSNSVYPTHGQPNLQLATVSDISTNDYKFGPGALRRDGGLLGQGSASCNPHTDYQFLTADFTIEFWFRIDSLAGTTVTIFDMRVGALNGRVATIIVGSTGDIGYFTNSAIKALSVAGTITGGVWYHIAYVRMGVGSPTVYTGTLYVNGTSVASWADNQNYNVNAKIIMGSDNGNHLHISFDDLRISNGVFGAGAARYTSNFTPPTAAFPDA